MHNGEWTGLDTIVGTGRDSLWTLTKSKKGEYSVQAIRGYCTYVLSKTIKIGLPVEIPALEGIELLCENQTKTLSLKNADMSATYYLWGRERDTLFDGIVSGRKDILFEDVPAGDTYVVIAEIRCAIRAAAYIHSMPWNCPRCRRIFLPSRIVIPWEQAILHCSIWRNPIFIRYRDRMISV